jgi:hypothetical protein
MRPPEEMLLVSNLGKRQPLVDFASPTPSGVTFRAFEYPLTALTQLGSSR